MVLAETKERNKTSSNINLAIKVFEEHGDFIRKIIRFHLKNEPETDDLFQDFFLYLVLKPIPKEVQNIRGFLYRVISDKAKDASRRITCYQERLRRYAKRRKRIIKNCPENIVSEAEENTKMFELIRMRLPPKEAEAVTLKYRNGCDIKEVAEKMGIRSRSISRYVSVGLKKVRQVFSVNGNNGYDSF